ncbi:copper-binding protein [Kitasatospora sp. MMS16-BH015]|uniref:cation transporter n=1 Tax=Kitasatospora sp. MMS16-BH015 TaxID=2018025 RepID=UPI000CA2C02C|nr:cation transporter [Kitasatospora sp. MMS16-BH015]AUG80679.1 copper-binding protein [Kitasatospora sp. MMS16-BH015]
MSENLLIETAESTGSCCGSCGTAPAVEEAATGAVREVYLVTGMTCGHCVSSVTAEVSKLAGVTKVAVDLATGQVTVDSAAALDRAEVAAAVDEAGYELA